MIHFIGNTQSNFGRGKDKTKRKSKLSSLFNRNNLLEPTKKSRIGLKTGLVDGLLTGRVSGLVGSTAAGATIDRQINKEKARFKKEGARSRLGKIGNDAKTGAIAAGLSGALQGAYVGAKINKGPLKQKLLGAGLSALASAKASAKTGAGIGAGIGTVRGFLQPNKKKNK